jgi:hypothetical protein
MKSSSRLLDRRLGYSLASLGMLLGVLAPAVVPAFASAGTITDRSITMGNASKDATSQYSLTFTPATTVDAGGKVIVDFCGDSPLTGTSCGALTGFNAGSASLDAGNTAPVTVSGSTDQLIFTVTSSNSLSGATTIDVDGIHNPSAVGAFYARIYTYTDAAVTAGGAHYYSAPDNLGDQVSDTGGVALTTTDTVGVTAYVLESMTFCVSGADGLLHSQTELSGDCGTKNASGANTSSGTASPSMTLGETNGSITALQSNALSTKKVLTQLSSNASSGVTVNMKSNATSCGGLFRNGLTANCDITPLTTAGSISAGDAKFGILVGNAASAAGAGTPSGTVAQDGDYSPTNYFMDYTAGNTAGVTSPYGSTLFHSTGPVNNKNVDLTFGASISNSTPAGIYGATMSLIATGKF